MQGVLQHSYLESLDLSRNPQLGFNFSQKLLKLLETHSQKYALEDLNLSETNINH